MKKKSKGLDDIKKLGKARSVTSLPAIRATAATKQTNSIQNKFKETQFKNVLKLKKLVNHRAKKRLNKSYSTNNISLNNKSSLSWNKHLELLQEYDYNRVILEELSSNIGLSNKEGGRLLSTLIARNNEIIEDVSSALGFERNRIDSITESNQQLSQSKTKLNDELQTMKQKFDNIKHQISDFNTSQSKHNQRLKLAQNIATQSKLKLHDKEYKSHIVHLNYKQKEKALLDTIDTLQNNLKTKTNRLATFEGYDIKQLFCTTDISNILLITNLVKYIKMDKIKSWFGTIKYNRISPLFPQCIFNIDANKDLLPYATFVEFDTNESAQFILELLHNRKTNEVHEEHCSMQVYFSDEYPTKYVSIRSAFSKTQLLRLYNRFGKVKNVTLCGQSYIIRFENESEASCAVLNTNGRRITLVLDINDTCNKTTSVIDAVFANDIENIQFEDDEPQLLQLSEAMQQTIFKLEQDLDEVENLLCVEWFPPEPKQKKEARLKLQKQYEPPNMSLIERYHKMLKDANERVQYCCKEIEVLQEVAKDKAPLKHLRKYIDPLLPSVEELNEIILNQKLENKKLEARIKNWKKKCNEFDEELEKSKTTLMELRIRHQTLKRMKCNRMAKMQRAKRRMSMITGANAAAHAFSDGDNDTNHDQNTNEGEYMLQIEELETKLMIAQEQIMEFKANAKCDKPSIDNEDSDSIEELQIQLTLLQNEMKEKNTEMMIIKTQLKDTTLKLNESYEQIEEFKMNQNDKKANHQKENAKTKTNHVEEQQVADKLHGNNNNTDYNETIQHLKQQLRNSEIEIKDLSEELTERNKEIQQFDANVNGEFDGKAMLQKYMKENETLKKELRQNKHELKDALTSNVNETSSKSAAVQDTKPVKQKQESESDQNRNITASINKEMEALKTQIARLKKGNKTLESTVSLKTVEMNQMKKEMTQLRQAKELCETLHVLMEEEEEENEEEEESAVKHLSESSVADRTTNNNNLNNSTSSNTGSICGTGKTTSRSMRSVDSSRARRGSIIPAKQQKLIADMIKSRDEAEKKVSQLKERSIYLEKTNKKLNKNVKALNAEMNQLKKQLQEIASSNTGADRININDSNQANTVDPQKEKEHNYSNSNSNKTTSRSSRTTNRKMSNNHTERSQVSDGRTERTETERSTLNTNNGNRSGPASGPGSAPGLRRSYSCATTTSSSSSSGMNANVADLQSEIKKLRKEIDMWRKVNRQHSNNNNNNEEALNRSSSCITQKYSKSAGQHKPLMVNKPKLKGPKAKHKVEKKWKMTRSRLMQITKGQHTKRSMKSKRWLLKTINEILDHKYKSDKNCLRENRAILPLPEFIYHEYIPSRFGIKNLVDAMCWDIHNAVQHYAFCDEGKETMTLKKEEFKEIITFKRFLEEDLSLNDLSFYLKARKVLLESKSLLLEDGFIPFKCINVLLDNIFDGTFKEYRLEMSLNIQSLSLLHDNENVIQKDLFLDFILKENQYLLHEFESAIQLLYFHFDLNNKNVVKKEDNVRALQFILKGLPTKSINDIITVMANGNNNESKISDTNDLNISKSFFIKPYMQFHSMCKNLFSWKQQFFLPQFCYNPNITQYNFHIMRSVTTRWNEFKGNMILPIVEMFEKHSNAYHVMSINSNNNNNNKDLLALTKVICRIRDYFEDINRLISLCLGWDVFLLYTHILSSIMQGFEILDQYELKRLISKQDINQNQCTKAVDNYLYLYEDYVMKRLKRAVATKRSNSSNAQSCNNVIASQYLHLKQQVLQN